MSALTFRRAVEIVGMKWRPDTSIESAAAPGAQAPHTKSRRGFLGAIVSGVGSVVIAPTVVGAESAQDGRGRSLRGDRDGRGDRVGRGGRSGSGARNGRRRSGDAREDHHGLHDGGGGPERFVRLFDLPPFAEPSEELREALIECGRPGGMMDALDPLEVGPVRLITEPELSPNNRDNPTHTAGVTFFGQFLDHDITRDAGSGLGRPTPVRRSMNLRSARMDLDSVYSGGPGDSPALYDGFRFRIESGGLFEDLPRDDEGVAVIGDDRNDENLMLSGLHAAFLLFHNAVIDDIATGQPTAADFAEAQATVRRHYQWIVVNEVLPQFVGQPMVDYVRTAGRQIFTLPVARIPLEFQTAAYRFGHSMIRPSYRANLAGDGGEPFFGLVFDPETFGNPDPDDLSGHSRAPRRFVGWQTFFDFDDGEVKPNKRIDTKLSTPLFQLPMFAIPAGRGEGLGPISLAARNLLRHLTWEIPSGQAIASEINAELLASADLADLGQLGAGLGASTPLFFYILREAEVMADGLHLGPVGGQIVAEVLLGLLELDPNSYLNAEVNWRPTLPQRNGTVGDDFRMADLLTISGVDPTSRGQ